MLRNLLNDESGFLVSAELVLIFTLVFCAVAVGVGVVKDSLATELGDIGGAIGALDQSYSYASLGAPKTAGNGSHATCAGSGFNDKEDECDCQGITIVAVNGKDDPTLVANPDADGT
jgi:hypothetical protein